jgi:hypothetical protein
MKRLKCEQAPIIIIIIIIMFVTTALRSAACEDHRQEQGSARNVSMFPSGTLSLSQWYHSDGGNVSCVKYTLKRASIERSFE